MPRDHYQLARLINGNGRRTDRTGYWVEWDEPPEPDGRRRRRKRRLPTRAEAIAFARRKSAEINAAMLGSIPWSTMIDRFDAATAQLAENTRASYLRTLASFGASAEYPAAHEISTDHVVRWVAQLAGQCEPQTVRKHLRHLRVLINLGLRQEPPWFVRDFSRSVRPPRAPRTLRRVPSIDDVASLLVATARRDDPLGWYLLVRLAFETGLRQMDLISLDWSHLRYEASPGESPRLLIIRTQGKTGRERCWGLSRGAEQAVELAREQRSQQAGPWRHWRGFRTGSWRALQGDAGVTLRYHGLRAAAAQYAANPTAGLQLAARLLDHAQIRTTREHYADDVRWAIAVAQALDAAPLPPVSTAIAPPPATRPVARPTSPVARSHPSA